MTNLKEVLKEEKIHTVTHMVEKAPNLEWEDLGREPLWGAASSSGITLMALVLILGTDTWPAASDISG